MPRGGERESFAKRQRERARMEKAEAKRQRRFDRKSATDEPEPGGENYESADQLDGPQLDGPQLDGPEQPDAPQRPDGDGVVEKRVVEKRVVE